MTLLSSRQPLQLDVEGLNITIKSASPASNDAKASSSTAASKGRAKAKGEGIEILSNAKLRLKEGQRYALVGRNGTGKSSESSLPLPLKVGREDTLSDSSLPALLKAIAEKLIPGIPEDTRIAILQQTRLTSDSEAESKAKTDHDSTVLQEVVEKATMRNAVEQEIRGMSHLEPCPNKPNI